MRLPERPVLEKYLGFLATVGSNAPFIGLLGTVFGTDRPEWSGASGVRLLTECARLVGEAGFRIGNVAVPRSPRPPADSRASQQA